ncbi:hypothetical protein K8I61_06665 [bacterium]|nr:hypothetical protein [bacterium]
MSSLPHHADAREEFAARLLAHPAVTRMRVPAGQFLIYTDQIPYGVFFVIDGALRFRGSEGSFVVGDRGDHHGSFVFPRVQDVERPCHADVSVARESDILFVPRTVALEDEKINALLKSSSPAVTPVSARSSGLYTD